MSSMLERAFRSLGLSEQETRHATAGRHGSTFLESRSLSHDDKREAVRVAAAAKFGTAGDGENDAESRAWVVEMYDEDAVVAVGEKRYRVPYTIDADGKATLGDAIEVTMQWAPVSTDAATESQWSLAGTYQRYVLIDTAGQPYRIVEAPSEVDADLYGLRHHASRHGRVERAPATSRVAGTRSSDEGLAEAFRAMGMDASLLSHAVEGRGHGRSRSLPVERIGRMEADPRYLPSGPTRSGQPISEQRPVQRGGAPKAITIQEFTRKP